MVPAVPLFLVKYVTPAARFETPRSKNCADNTQIDGSAACNQTAAVRPQKGGNALTAQGASGIDSALLHQPRPEQLPIPLIFRARGHPLGGWRRSFEMTRRCELTGKLPLSGQLRSHAENKTKRKFRPNLCEVTLISDALGRKVRLRVSAHALKSVEHRGGLDAFLLKASDEDLSERCLKLKRDLKKAKAAAPAAAA